ADSDLGTNTFSYTVANDDGVTDVGIVSLTTEVPCFTRGAMVETEQGPRPIQELAVGDLVATRDAGMQPIRWIGARRIKGDQSGVAPIRIAPGAFGADRRHLVSPQHRILLTGWRAEVLFGAREVLAAAKHLVDDKRVRKTERNWVEYWHILLDQHQVLTVDGVASESFHPGHASLDMLEVKAREEVLDIFPELRVAPGAYGPSSRRSLKQFEAQTFALA
ncbi:MAG: Hint domain-containing protein, partial [Pseudomonadota bacterium]